MKKSTFDARCLTFFALKAGIGDNAAHPSGPTISFHNGMPIATASNLLINGCMA